MKTIIAGSRTIIDYPMLKALFDAIPWEVTEVVCGLARGVDKAGKSWAESKGIPVAEFPAAWGMLGPIAGFVRNQQMAEYADAAFIVWDGKSRGTRNMIALCEAFKLKYKVYVV